MLNAKEKLFLTMLKIADPAKVTDGLLKETGNLVDYVMYLDFAESFHEMLDAGNTKGISADILTAANMIEPGYNFDWCILQRRLHNLLVSTEKWKKMSVEEYLTSPLGNRMIDRMCSGFKANCELMYDYTDVMYDQTDELKLTSLNGSIEVKSAGIYYNDKRIGERSYHV